MLNFFRISFILLLSILFLAVSVKAACPLSDLNGDCRVDMMDMVVFAGQWLLPTESPADLNGDDVVDMDDFALLANDWGTSGIPLSINELMASNEDTIKDPQNDNDDWVEIYNYGPETIDMGGMYLTDNLSDTTKWQIPSGTIISAGGYLLIWIDNDTSDPGLHAGFKLSAGGEDIALFAGDGSILIDSVTFPEQVTDVSFGRYPDAGQNLRFFPEPSPGQQNNEGYLDEVHEVQFSHERGFYDDSFLVTIATETEDAKIYYTLDGSDPGELLTSSGRYTGTLYTEPIAISGTSYLRARAVKAGWKPSEIDTHTYIFISDVITQSPQGQAPGPDWPSGSVNGQEIDYGMDPEIVDDPQYASLMDEALLSIPTISLVTNLKNLFEPSIGIYVNAIRDGRDWERPTSLELINPDGSEGFHVNAGLRIRGGYSRQGSCPKHAFRLFFRPEYGDSKLRFALFGDEGVDEFDCVDLTTAQNFSWSFKSESSDSPGSRNTFLREVFSRDLQREMGQPYTRSRYYHLYINGQYWGLYLTQERSEASYGESYFGGDKDDYDVIKVDAGPGRPYTIEDPPTDGNLDACYRLWEAAIAGFDTDEAYYRVQGMNPDGTFNPNYERLVDIDNLIDYMIDTFYVGDPDGPIALNGTRPNNYYGIYNRNNPDGFKFFRHDAEWSMFSVYENRTYVVSGAGEYFYYFNPQWLHHQFSVHPEYRMNFADHVYRFFFNGGILTPEAAANLLNNRKDQIDLAIIAESARWGDAKASYPRTKYDNWIPEVNYLLNSYFPYRTNIVLRQFKDLGWYPDVDAPVFSDFGLQVDPGFYLSMYSSRGTVYYSLDGSDPRLSDITPGDSTTTTLVAEDADKKALVPTGNISNNWRGGGNFDDSGWLSCTGSPGGVGYDTDPTYQGHITLDVEDQMHYINTTCYIRIPFDLEADPENLDFMSLNIKYDDGFIAYLNGVEVAKRNFTGTPAWNSHATASHDDSLAVLFEEVDISSYLGQLKSGSNILAIHGMNTSPGSSDLLISVELFVGESPDDPVVTEGVIQYTGPISLNQSAHVMARVLDNRDWSALNETYFSVGPVAENLRITEIMYHPAAPIDSNDPNEEFIELTNIGSETINLNLVKFTNGIDFTFSNTELTPGGRILVVEDIDAFEAAYGSGLNVAGQYTGVLNNNGEKICLEDAIGQIIQEFSYSDGWRSLTDGQGFSLTIIDSGNPDPNSWSEKESWRPSADSGGSPGWDDSGIVPNPGAIVINEILSHSHETSDWIELYNTTGSSIDIGGWYLSDSDANLTKYKIASGTTIDPDHYMVFYEDLHFNNPGNPGSIQSFSLSENGESVYLSSADESDVLTGYRQVEDFGASQTDVSFGRYYKASTNNYNFVAMSENTPGAENSEPLVGPVVISEIMYNPNWPEGGSYTNDQYEYIELCNISDASVMLYDSVEGVGWKFTEGIDYTFPSDAPVTIPSGDYLLIVKHVDAFKWRYPEVPADKILGPYDGKLNNAGERVELGMPGDEDVFGERKYIRLDRIDYSDGSHPEDCPGNVDLWPVEADGGGQSLTRVELSEYGNDPDNWTAADPTLAE